MSSPLRVPLALSLVALAAAAPTAVAPGVPVGPVAGSTPGLFGDHGPATQAGLANPGGVTVMPDGALLIADTDNHRIRRVAPDGTITTVVGDDDGLAGDGGPAVDALLSFPTDVAATSDAGYLIADAGNDRVRKVSAAGIISTVAGTDRGLAGDGGPATAARLNTPRELAPEPGGGFLFADAGNDRVRRVAPDGTIATVAGTLGGLSGDGGPATAARLDEPTGVAFTADGGFLISDAGNGRVRKVSPAGIISTVAGAAPGFSGDGGRAVAAQLARPGDVIALSNGGFLIADTGNGRLRRVTPLGAIFTIVSGLGAPSALLPAPAGGAFVTDSGTSRVGRIGGFGTVPDPEQARSIGVDKVAGAVSVAPGPGAAAIALNEADLTPNRSDVDALAGSIALTVRRREGVGLATAQVGGGTFSMRQAATGPAIADLTLTGAITGCPRASAAGRAREDARTKRRNRRLDIRVKGAYRTRGRYASAIASGTRWTIVDGCDRTVIRVTEGVVKVRDLRLNRQVKVRAGTTYVALARRPRR